MSQAAIHEASSPPVTRVQIARYAAAVDDFNPIHVDEEFARAAGMPSVIAHGPLTVAVAVDLLVGQLGPEALAGLDARLTAPVFPGDRITLVPTESGAEGRKDDGTVVLRLTVTRA
jgi:acyl dehydratase